MKKLVVVIFSVLLSISLIACKEKIEINLEFVNIEVGLTFIDFGIELEDEDEQITGTVSIELYRGNEKVRTKTAMTLEDLEVTRFEQLVTDTAYEIRVYATVGRDSILAGSYGFRTLSAETIYIETPEDFMNMKNNRSGNYVLSNDLDFTDVTFAQPFSSSFSGTFDGQDYTISNIEIKTISTYTGVFGYVSTGTIKNLVLDQIVIGTEDEPLAMSTSARVGILAGYVANSTSVIENITIKNSQIHFSTSSTVHAYVGGAVGEQRGSLTDLTLENIEIGLVSKSYGRIKLGGAVGLLNDDAILRRVSSDTNIAFDLEAQNTRNRNFSIIVGGVIGDNTSKRVSRAVQEIYSTGDITISKVNFNTLATATEGNYSFYVGGLAGISYSNIYQGFYAGNISVTHEKSEHDGIAYKAFFVGGIIGAYASNAPLEYVLRVSDPQKMITVNVSDDVVLRASQSIGNIVKDDVIVHTGLVGTPHLLVNDLDETGNDSVNLINDVETFFKTEWIKAQYNLLFAN